MAHGIAAHDARADLLTHATENIQLSRCGQNIQDGPATIGGFIFARPCLEPAFWLLSAVVRPQPYSQPADGDARREAESH